MQLTFHLRSAMAWLGASCTMMTGNCCIVWILACVQIELQLDGSHAEGCWLCFQPSASTVISKVKGLRRVIEMVAVSVEEMNNCEKEIWKGKHRSIILLSLQVCDEQITGPEIGHALHLE